MSSRVRISHVVVAAVLASAVGAGPLPVHGSVAGVARGLRDVASVAGRPLASAAGPRADEVTDAAWLRRRVTSQRAETATVAVPASGLARAGGTPVRIGRATSGTAPAAVSVTMLSAEQAKAKGFHGLGFALTRADGGETESTVAVELDYSSIATMYGGNFASRLRLVQVGECGDDSCPPTVTGAGNDLVDETLTVDVPVAPRTRATSGTTTSYTTFGASSGPSGSAGNYTATSASPSDSWSVGIGSGAFTYSYDIDVPPAIGGAAPGLSLGYSSQSVDGRTVAENGQPSIAGEGWSLEPGYIERKFSHCSNGNDLCWSADNEYVLGFGGRSGELVRVGTTNEWRVRGQDPAWRVLSFTGTYNSDNDTEYFVLITPNGTKHWFGLGYEPRNATMKYTNSTWEVPVYGGAGEPCYNATASASWCQQAYRWNVDYVKDTNNNVTSYFYTKEYNYYSRGGSPSLSTRYVRGGYLSSIEYAQRYADEDAPHPASVTFYTSNRCAAQVSCPTPSPANASAYPDVPLDQMCAAAPCSSTQNAPTFWTTRQLDQIASRTANSAGAYENAFIYDLTYTFPPTGDTTSPSLWLDLVRKTGAVGPTSMSLPAVAIDGVRLANRVNTGTGVPAMNKWRVSLITDEYGGRIAVTYDTPRPCPLAPAYPNFADNPYHCFPAWYQPPTGSGAWVSFHKYVVTQTVVSDAFNAAPQQTTTYTYDDAPAWHYSDSVLAPAGTQSWADYRGHSKVSVVKTTYGLATGEVTKYVLFRGMHGDKLTATTSKSVTVTDTNGNTFYDHHYLAGLPADTQRFTGGGVQLTSTMQRYTGVQTANGPDGWQSHDAQYVQNTNTVERVFNLDVPGGGSYRDHWIDRTFNAVTNAVESVSDLAGPGTADDTCTEWFYTDNRVSGVDGTHSEWIVDAPYRMSSFAGSCGSGSYIAKSEYYYDGHAALGDDPTGRNVTKRVDWVNLGAQVTTETTYDSYGRVTGVISPNEVANGLRRKTTTAYSPATGYPYNGITTTNLLGHAEKTEIYVPLGSPYRVTGANGDVTTVNVDSLGRTTSVQRPGDSASNPSLKFEYSVPQTSPSRVKTSRLLSGSQYVVSYDYYDGLARLVEHQDPPANDGGTGRRVTVTSYDTHGRMSGVSQPMYNSAAAGSGLLNPAETAMPFETRYGYDALGRRDKVAQYASGVWKWTTYTDYRGIYERVTSPVSDRGEVEYHRDVFGRTTKIVEHPTAGGTANTSYAYTPRGDIATITDDAGRVTTYTYDWLRRRATSDDPDLGVWETGYDADGNPITVKDARLQTLRTVYDAIGRKTAVHVGSTAGTKLASWTYDDTSVANSLGRLTSATRYVGTDDYVSRVTGYDLRGRTSSRQVVVPTSEGTLAGTYQYGYEFNDSDMVTSVTMPAVGTLVAETVGTTYNSAGLPTSLVGAETYVASTTYASDGRLAEQRLGSGATKVVRTYEYDSLAGRPSRSATTYGTTVIEDATVTYDAASNVRSVLDVVAGAGGAGQRECFRYDDGVQRLTHAYTTGTTCASSTAAANPDHAFGADPYDVKYAYDDSGDITSTTDGMTGTTKAYTYGATGPKHGVVTVGSTHAYGYDANGNVTTRTVNGTTVTLGWDELNRLASSTPTAAGSTATTYRYGADGTRMIRRTGSDATLYLDGAELTSAGVGTRYYGEVAMRKSTATGSDVTVLLRNRQGSASVAVNPATGAVVSRRRYLPFGGDRAAAAGMPTERGFLDKTQDPNGLYQVGARYYEASIGRFVSPDPLSVLSSPQTLAAYTYSAGNPATFSDPTGLVMQRGDVASSDPVPPQPNPDPPTNAGTQAGKGPAPVPTATPGPAPVTPEPEDPRDSARSNGKTLGERAVTLANNVNGANRLALKLIRTFHLGCYATGNQFICTAPPSGPVGRGGFTIGNYFFSRRGTCPDNDFMEHEYVHTKQWAVLGLSYIPQYFSAEAGAWMLALVLPGESSAYNPYEVQAGLEKGDYPRAPWQTGQQPSPSSGGPTPAPPIPGPSPWAPPTGSGSW